MSTYTELVNRAEAAALAAEQSASNTSNDKTTVQGYLTRMEAIVASSSTISDPVISVNTSTGVVTATCTASAGNVLQNATKTGTLTLSTVPNINLDPAIIKDGETILGVLGTYQGTSGQGGSGSSSIYRCTEVLDDGSYSDFLVSGSNHPDYNFDGQYTPYGGTLRVNGKPVYKAIVDGVNTFMVYTGYDWVITQEWDEEYPDEAYGVYTKSGDNPTGTYQSESIINEEAEGFDWEDESTWVYGSCTVTEQRTQATRTPSWSGKLGTAGANGYTFANTVTTNLPINPAFVPEIGRTYTDTGFPVQVPIAGVESRQDDCILYVPFKGSVEPLVGSLERTIGSGGITFPSITFGQTTRQVMQTTGNCWFIYNMIRPNISPVTVAIFTKADIAGMSNENFHYLFKLWTDKSSGNGPGVYTSPTTWLVGGRNHPSVVNEWTSVIMIYGGINQTSVYINGTPIEYDITGNIPIHSFRSSMRQYGNELAQPICSLGGESNTQFMDEYDEEGAYSVAEWAALQAKPLFQGQICDFGIWAREWTKTEIEAHAAKAATMRA